MGDVIALEDEHMPSEPLLRPVMHEGKRESPPATLAELQRRCQSQMECLPAAVRAPAICDQPYSVRHSARLEALLQEVHDRITRTAPRS